jgi:predicted esterase
MNLETYQMPEASVLTNELKSKDDWLDPLFIAPRAPHTRSLIILHGRGDNAYSFAKGLLSVRISKAKMNLAEVLPDTKFIFPTSKLRRAVVLNRTKIAQWFDVYTLEDPDQRQEIQHEGLHDSAMFVHDIIRQEAKLVGLANVVLGGLSQGCALGLHVLMSFQGEIGQHLGGFFGMSGWLPFAKQLEALSEDKEAGSVEADSGAVPRGDKDRRENPFGNDTPRGDGETTSGRATQFVKLHVMDYPSDKINNEPSSVPIFLGHGEMDEKVSMSLGEDAARIMAKLGWKVTWKSYVDLGHWYSRKELEEIVSFVQGLGSDCEKE